MKNKINSIFFIIVLILLQGCLSRAEMTEMRIGGEKILVEMADTPSERQKGLQGRKVLSENHGMLFLFPVAQTLSFWSKDTSVPLSIAFIDDSGKIVQIENLPPEQLQPVQSNQPLRYALEVNSGWFERHNVGIGDRLRIEK